VNVVRLAEIRETPLSVDEVYAQLPEAASGAVVSFVGRVRDHHQGEPVAWLDYTAHPTAESVLREVCAEVAAEFEVLALAAVHRVGHLEIGDIAVIAAVASGHRHAGFAATEALINRLKARVPIWKHEGLQDGREIWVGADQTRD
jgi:molybdopterin synthase catalytic subunit